MRFKTFRALVIGGGLLGVFGIGTAGIWYVQQHEGVQKLRNSNTASTVVTMAPQTSVTAMPGPTAVFVSGVSIRPQDREILAKLKTPIAGDKLKDALHGSPWKVNLYQDAGKTTPNRVKIDFNRNEKYDEKWSVEGTTIKREVAPADDEKYTQEYVLSPDSSLWQLSSGGVAFTPVPGMTAAVVQNTPTNAVAPAGSIALRPMDTMILDRVAKDIPGDKVKDAIPGQSWKVNLYKDPGQAKVNRLKIDLDRDEKWDEKWTFTHADGRDEVKREVAPNDDEVYSVEYRLRAGAWVRKAP